MKELEDLLPSRPEVPNIIGDTEEVELQEFDSTRGSGGGQRREPEGSDGLRLHAVKDGPIPSLFKRQLPQIQFSPSEGRARVPTRRMGH